MIPGYAGSGARNGSTPLRDVFMEGYEIPVRQRV
jgi:hypothetical protein